MSKHHSNGSPLESQNGTLPLSNDELVETYTPLVRLIAEHIHRRLPPGIDLGSLIHAGIVGILEAKARFDPKRGAQFQTYARYRIQGEIMEYLRSLDWVSRSTRHWGRRVEAAKKHMVDRVVREITSEEVAAELGISLEEYFHVESRIDRGTMLSLEGMGLNTIEQQPIDSEYVHSINPETLVEHKSLLERLTVCREELPELEQLVLTSYYEEGMTLCEIAEMLGVTEGRICQIHNDALLFLRDIFDTPSVKKHGSRPRDNGISSDTNEIEADLMLLLEEMPPSGEDIEASLQILFDDL